MLNVQNLIDEYQLNLNNPAIQRVVNRLSGGDPGYNPGSSSFDPQQPMMEQGMNGGYTSPINYGYQNPFQQTMYTNSYNQPMNNGINYQNPFQQPMMYDNQYYNNGINYQNPFQQQYNTYSDRNSIPQDLNNFDDVNFYMQLPDMNELVQTPNGSYMVTGWYDDTMYGGFIDQTGRYIPCKYDCETYNQALYRKYTANGSRPMYINWATGYKKYNPMHDYCYKPSAREYELAYKYFEEMYPDFGTFAVKTADKKYQEWAAQFDNQCSPSIQQNMQTQPYIVTDTMPCDYELSDDQFCDVARQLYKNNVISLNEYTAVANGGIEYTTDNGTTVNQNVQFENNQNNYGQTFSPFGWGGYGYNPQYYQELQKQQEAYYQHTVAMDMAYNVARRFNGITDEEMQQQQMEQARQYQEQMGMMAQQYQKASYDWDYDSFADSVNNAPCSDQKDYISPLKAQYMNHYNKVYEDRHKHVNPDMTWEDFMINGGYADIVFDDMRYENRKEIHKLAREFDGQAHREFMHRMNPWYDPVTGTVPIRGLKLGKNDIEVPLSAQEKAELHANYEERRQAFLNTISSGHQHAPVGDVDFFRSHVDAITELSRMNFLNRNSLGQQLSM